MSAGVVAQNDFGARCRIEAKTLGADGNSAIGTDLDGSTNAPDKRPPGATRHRTQGGAFFLLCQIPCLERFHLQLPMDLMRIAMLAQVVQVFIGLLDLGDLLAGEVSGKSLLPELMTSFDLPFGAGRGSVTEADAIKSKRPAQLSERVGNVAKEQRVIIDINFQGQAPLQKSTG